MKKILSFIFLTAALSSFAQQAPIAIVSVNGTTKLTSTLDSASFLAQTNDIIYLPGGSINGMSNWFTKKVTVMGVGHNPDSSAATNRTEINGHIGFQEPGSILDGVHVSENVYITNDCKIYRTNASYIVPPWTSANNILVDKCVIRNGIYGQYALTNITNSVIRNTIINANVNFTQQIYHTTYENCIFLQNGLYNIEQAVQCTFKNSTFTGITSWGNPSNSYFYNNVFTSAGYPPLTDSSHAIANIINQTGSSTFVNEPSLVYSYGNSYNLKAGSPAIGGGMGGTDIGIYGGSYPWIAGNIPPNPHIRTKNVDPATGSGGLLRVRFIVSTQ